MIIIAGTIEIDPDQREAALAAGQPHIEGALTQDGCEAYTWAADHVPGRVQVFERWTGEEQLAAHFRGPHYLAMLQTMGAHGLIRADVSKYRSDHREPVYDPSGKPRADFFTEKA